MNYKEVNEEQRKFFLYSFRKYGNLIHNYVVSRIRNSDDAEDIMQDIFIKLWKTKSTDIRSEKAIRKYLIYLANQCLVDYYRKRKLEVSITETEKENEQEKLSIENFDGGQRRKAIATDLIDRLRDFLPTDKFIILYSRLVEDLSIREIADMFGIKPRSARYIFDITQVIAKSFIESITKKGVPQK